jgi:hypothetical protein
VRRTTVPVLVAASALALPASAAAKPNPYALELTLQPGQVATLTVGQVPRGEFAFRLRASSDGEKAIRIRQGRLGGQPFTVLDTAGGPAADACEGAAGTLVCRDITTPAPRAATWAFAVRNRGDRPAAILLTITWRRVGSAG